MSATAEDLFGESSSSDSEEELLGAAKKATTTKKTPPAAAASAAASGKLAMLGWAGMCSQELVNHKTIADTIDFYQKVYAGVNPYESM
jgi:hypothetical protein